MAVAKTSKKTAPKKTTKTKTAKPKAKKSSLSQFAGKATNKNMRGKLLVIVDETTEAMTALRFAGVSAKRLDSNVALLMVLEPAVMRHWLGVENIMEEETRQDAMEKMQILASEVADYAKIKPDIFIRQGTKFEALVKLVEEDKDITAIVIGVPRTAAAAKTAGPLVDKLLSGELEKLGLPVIIVPEDISDHMLRRIARIV